MTDNSMELTDFLRKAAGGGDVNFLREGVRVLAQALRELEVSEQIGAAKHERSDERSTHRNGYRERLWDTAAGAIEFKIPKVREGSYMPSHGVLARDGQGRLRDRDREPKVPAVRYEHAAPGDLIHIDVKKLGRLGEGGGWRFGGRETKKRARGIGCDFVHVAIDDHSRLAYVEVHADERADTVAGFTRRAIEHYGEHGIEVKRLLTDNAMSYYSHAQLAVLAEHGVKRLHTRPYRPQTNGKAERFIRLLINGWAYRRPYESNGERLSALPRWVFNYNHRRPHGGIGGLPPISRVPGVNNVSGQNN